MCSRKTVVSLAILVAAGVFGGCSAKGLLDVDLADQASPTSPEQAGVVLPPPSQNQPSEEDGGLTPADAGKDASKPPKDAGPVDAGPPPPEPGTACATLNQIYKRACGACGVQEAVCLVQDADAGVGVVSEYEACRDEIPASQGGCVPGTTVTEACGNCGTQVKTCPSTCIWKKDACKGEPLESCSAGTVAWATAGCPAAGTFRQRSCSATCTWQPFSAECGAPEFALTIPATVGETAKGIFPLIASRTMKRVTGTCGDNAIVAQSEKHPFVAVQVTNPTAQTATVSAWNTYAPNGGKLIDTAIAAYPQLPTNDDELKKNCQKAWGDYCPTTGAQALDCGDSKFGALTGAQAVTIPPNGTVTILFTTARPHPSLNDVTEGPVQLVVRTDALAN